jgi:hypothetical protein
MRILCIGIAGLPSGVQSNLATANVLQDHDAIVVNPKDLKTLYDVSAIDPDPYLPVTGELSRSESGAYVDRVSDSRKEEVKALLGLGGVLVCLMHPARYWSYSVRRPRKEATVKWISNYDWLGFEAPFDECLHNLEFGIGDTINFFDQSHPFAAYLRNKPRWTAFVRHKDYSHWKVLASAFGDHDVALTCRQGRGHVVFLPSGRFDGDTELLETCIKDLLGEKEFREKPTWVREILVPGQKEVLEEIQHTEAEIDKLQKKRCKLDSSDEQLERWKWLLWETGRDHLEPVVREALMLIGCKVEPQPVKESDGKIDSEFGVALLSVEGTVGPVTRDKLGQLVVNIGNFLTEKGVSPKGIFVGNPFRKERLDNRPPKGSQKKLFAKELIEDAENLGITVLLSTDLYDVVCGILERQIDENRKKELRQDIFGGKGLVRLQPQRT